MAVAGGYGCWLLAFPIQTVDVTKRGSSTKADSQQP